MDLPLKYSSMAPNLSPVAENGDLYISDTGNHRLRRVSAESGMMSTVYATPDLLPGKIAIDNLNGIIYFTDRGKRQTSIYAGRVITSVMRILPSGDVAPFLRTPDAAFGTLFMNGLDVDVLGNVFLMYRPGWGFTDTKVARYNPKSATQDSVFVTDGAISAFSVTRESDIYYIYPDYYDENVYRVYRYGTIDLGSGFKDVGREEIVEHTGAIWDMTLDKKGNVLVANLADHRIFRITNETSFAPQVEFPGTFEIGDVIVGAKKTHPLELFNKGNMGLSILRLSSSVSGLSFQPASGDIDSGATEIFDVLIEPSASGTIKGTIDVLSTDPDESSISIPIVGTAFAAEIGLDLESGPENQSVQVLKGVAGRDSVTVQLFGSDMPTLSGYSATLQYDPAFIDTNTIAFESGPLIPNTLAIMLLSEASMTIGAAATGSSLSEIREGLMGTLSFVVSEDFEPPDSTDISLTNVTFSLGDGTLLKAARSGSITLSAEIALVGDFDGDASVGFSDFLQFAQGFEKKSTDAGFDSRLDLDSDGEVGLSDFLLFAANFGATT